MASIPLRVYLREIENLIESGQLDEAIAHCRHILQTFPKHIETYRVLGKAYLENQRYAEALDIFSRVLSTVPDDFISNVGMSIIREDENNLDSAIWHMERAFETQPSNTAIQEELRRLYGRRDGLEPLKIRLTRGALARMYSRGGLYDQAIGELRVAISEDPRRPDLQALLARMYALNGERVQAVETCSKLLSRFPHCLEANRVLAAILPQTERAEDTHIYQQRLFALDPYFSHADPTSITSEEVPENAILIERLIYKPGEPVGGMAGQPAWAASLGIAFEDRTGEELPDWLAATEAERIETERVSPFTSVSPFTPEDLEDADVEPLSELETGQIEIATGEEIPDWMRAAGWEPAEAGTEAGLMDEMHEISSFEEVSEETAAEIARAEIPDWLRDVAPEGAFEDMPERAESQVEGAEPVPWLEETQPGPSDTIISWLEETKPEAPVTPDESTTDREIPDWLQELGPGMPEKTTEESLEEIPDWLKELGPAATESTPESGVTDWLKEYTEEVQPESKLPEGEPSTEIPPAIQPETTEFPAEISHLAKTSAEVDLSDQDAALAWLESLAAQHGAAEEELLTKPEERLAAPPEWVRMEAESEAAPQELTEPVEAEPAEKIPDWLKEMAEEAQPETEALEVELPEIEVPPITPSEAEPAEEIPDWLKEMAEEAQPEIEAPEVELPEIEISPIIPSEAEPAEEIPDWLKEMAEEAQPEIEAPEVELPEIEVPPIIPSEAEPAEEIPDWLKEMAEEALPETELLEGEPSTEIPPAIQPEAIEFPAEISHLAETSAEVDLSDQDAALAWLESLAAQHGAAEEELLTKPEERLAAPPEWVRMEAESEAAAFGFVEPTEPPSAEEIPDWLQEISPEEPVETRAPEGESSTNDELIAWLQDVAAETEIKPQAEITEIPAEATPLDQTPAAIDLGDQDAALAWLESLAAKQGVSEEELLTKPEERLTAPPEWVRLEAEEEAAPSSSMEPLEVPSLGITPGGLKPTEELEPEYAGPDELIIQEAAALPAEWISEEQEIVPSEETLSTEAEQPVININTASLSDLEDLPGIGFVLAQSIISYREVNGPFTEISELQNISGIGPYLVEQLENRLTTGLPLEQPVPEEGTPEAILMRARNAIDQNDPDQAVELYNRLTKEGYDTDVLVPNLQQALYRFPLNIDLWQALGDAYIRNNQLQEALEAYTKAEELLR
jgi:competence ComEA-like helix-hairpin-helix protein